MIASLAYILYMTLPAIAWKKFKIQSRTFPQNVFILHMFKLHFEKDFFQGKPPMGSSGIALSSGS